MRSHGAMVESGDWARVRHSPQHSQSGLRYFHVDTILRRVYTWKHTIGNMIPILYDNKSDN